MGTDPGTGAPRPPRPPHSVEELREGRGDREDRRDLGCCWDVFPVTHKPRPLLAGCGQMFALSLCKIELFVSKQTLGGIGDGVTVDKSMSRGGSWLTSSRVCLSALVLPRVSFSGFTVDRDRGATEGRGSFSLQQEPGAHGSDPLLPLGSNLFLLGDNCGCLSQTPSLGGFLSSKTGMHFSLYWRDFAGWLSPSRDHCRHPVCTSCPLCTWLTAPWPTSSSPASSHPLPLACPPGHVCSSPSPRADTYHSPSFSTSIPAASSFGVIWGWKGFSN